MDELKEKVTTITKKITKAIVNEADKNAVEIDIYDINDEDGVVTCRLLDTDGKVVATKRVYEINNLPCDPITDDEREVLYPIEAIEKI
jgi:hypothetical protein